jgi:hypothetical protein
MSLKNILYILLAGVVFYISVTWGNEYHLVSAGQECANRMADIEKAKAEFMRKNPGATPSSYADILPYLPYTGVPLCPLGGRYEHELDAHHLCTCSLNGNPSYEPPTTMDPLKNGYHDLAVKREKINILEFLSYKIQGVLQGKTIDPNLEKEKIRKNIFNKDH